MRFGFTDAVGRGELNRVLSEARATQVRNTILFSLPLDAKNDLAINVVGDGEMMPLAHCEHPKVAAHPLRNMGQKGLVAELELLASSAIAAA